VGAAADLDRHRYLSLSTFRRNGAEVATPVWFAADGAKLYVFTLADSGKVKRLRHIARVLTEPAAIERAHAALRRKYGWQLRVADLMSTLSGRIRRRAWIEIDVE